jgi:hypothetical protein
VTDHSNCVRSGGADPLKQTTAAPSQIFGVARKATAEADKAYDVNAPKTKTARGRVGRPRGDSPPKTDAQRQAQRRWRQAAGGGRFFTVALDKDARLALERLLATGRLPSQAAAFGIAIRYLEQQMDRGLRRVEFAS